VTCESKDYIIISRAWIGTDLVWVETMVLFAIYLQIIYDFIRIVNRISPSLALPLTIATIS